MQPVALPAWAREGENWRSRCVLPLLALFGHGAMSDLSPLSGVKRKSVFGAVRSAFDPSATSAVIPLAAIFCKDVVGSKAANATGLSISKSMLPRADQDDRMRRREFLQFAGFVAIAAAKPLVAGRSKHASDDASVCFMSTAKTEEGETIGAV